MTNHSVGSEMDLGRRGETEGARGSPEALNRSARRFWIGGIIVVLFFFILGFTGYVENWLWMRQLDYVGVFWTVLSVQVGMGVLAFLLVFGFLWVNLHEAVRGGSPQTAAAPWRSRRAATDGGDAEAAAERFPVMLKAAFVLVSAGVALLYALALSGQWDSYLRFRYGGLFGFADPLYGVDVGFYVFHLPFYLMLQRGLLLLTALTLGIVLVNCQRRSKSTAVSRSKSAAQRQARRPPISGAFLLAEVHS